MTIPLQLGVVIIGRNEGQRLSDCLQSLSAAAAPIVYVDSGSTDDSRQRAADLGAIVVELSLEQPFTAGRARNAGFRRLLELHPDTALVQFVDGDCRVAENWLRFARDYLQAHKDTAIVCGRRKELHPEHSVYNHFCDFEWDTPIGEAASCGGDFMVRAQAFADIGGFNDSLIAGEEPELCFRLRQAGWTVYRADAPMTSHDAAMHHLSQWFRRSKRAGYAYAAGAALHRDHPDRFNQRENLRILFWALLLPLAIICGALLGSPWLLLLFGIYPLQVVRMSRYVRSKDKQAPAGVFGLLLVAGKWPEFSGQLLYLRRRLAGDEQRIIEYK